MRYRARIPINGLRKCEGANAAGKEKAEAIGLLPTKLNVFRANVPEASSLLFGGAWSRLPIDRRY
jgi:hypothetical protein